MSEIKPTTLNGAQRSLKNSDDIGAVLKTPLCPVDAQWALINGENRVTIYKHLIVSEKPPELRHSYTGGFSFVVTICC